MPVDHTTPLTELCDHIVVRRHGPLRPALDRITHLLATVARVHGKEHPHLVDLQTLFATTRAGLEEHLRIEEAELFPACRAIDAHDGPTAGAVDQALLASLEDQHAATGAALRTMRELAGGYDTDTALCSTHRETLAALHAFELALHEHVHEESELLFPRIRPA